MKIRKVPYNMFLNQCFNKPVEWRLMALHLRVTYRSSLDVFAYDFSVTALTPSKYTKERPSPFLKISKLRRCLGAKDRGTCLKKRYEHGIAIFLKSLKVICALARISILASA